MKTDLIRTTDLDAGYDSRAVLRQVCLEASPGQILTLIGPNGSGKSTLLRTIAGMLPPVKGMVYLKGTALRQMGEKDRSRTMSVLMTERIRPELMTVHDVVAAGRYPYTGRFGIPGEKDREQIAGAMRMAGVEELSERDFSKISDGQKQRVLLARAICQEPEVMVMDEPASYLDIRYKLELLQILRRLAKQKGIAIIMSLHELELARNISDRLVSVKGGVIERIAAPGEMFAGDYIRQLYDADPASFEEVYGYLGRETVPESVPANGKSGLHGRGGSGHLSADSPYYVSSGQKKLRCGYTTGTCAALAAAGAARLLLAGEKAVSLSLRTPKGLTVDVIPEFCRMSPGGAAECGIRKDAGDDPDITDGVIVTACVEKTEQGFWVDGGEGVGRVTKPGLDQPVGAAAINRVPRRMIEEQLRLVSEDTGYEGGLRAVISIPGGEALARNTLNSQLGIEAGLSVLGTSGIVEPMSRQALLDSIRLCLEMAKREGDGRLILTPGNYGYDFLRESDYDLPGVPAVKMSNFVGDALDMAADLGFEEVLVVGHIGKLVKLAGGIMNTHSGMADCRRELFCAHAALCGGDRSLCQTLMQAATTEECLEQLQGAGLQETVMESLLTAMDQHLVRHVRGAFIVGAVTFSSRQGLLGMTEAGRDLLERWRDTAAK